ncbi:hypothetical protein LXL04_038337 [Taraxacum kok-saghyz]
MAFPLFHRLLAIHTVAISLLPRWLCNLDFSSSPPGNQADDDCSRGLISDFLGYLSLRRLQQRKTKARKKETLQKSYANFNVEGLQMLKLLMKLFILTRSGHLELEQLRKDYNRITKEVAKLRMGNDLGDHGKSTCKKQRFVDRRQTGVLEKGRREGDREIMTAMWFGDGVYIEDDGRNAVDAKDATKSIDHLLMLLSIRVEAEFTEDHGTTSSQLRRQDRGGFPYDIDCMLMCCLVSPHTTCICCTESERGCLFAWPESSIGSGSDVTLAGRARPGESRQCGST